MAYPHRMTVEEIDAEIARLETRRDRLDKSKPKGPNTGLGHVAESVSVRVSLDELYSKRRSAVKNGYTAA